MVIDPDRYCYEISSFEIGVLLNSLSLSVVP